MAAAVALIIIAVVLLCIAPLIGVLVGAFAGWVVGMAFPDTMGLLAQMLHIEAAPWQLGAIFGFVGGFFRSTSTTTNKS